MQLATTVSALYTICINTKLYICNINIEVTQSYIVKNKTPLSLNCDESVFNALSSVIYEHEINAIFE
jgi:hypothetical protein